MNRPVTGGLDRWPFTTELGLQACLAYWQKSASDFSGALILWRGSKLPRHYVSLKRLRRLSEFALAHWSGGKPPSRPFARDRKQFLLQGGKLPSEEIAANPAYTPPGSNEARGGLRALSRSPGEERRAAGKPLSSPRPPRSGQPPPPPQQRRISAAKLPINPAPAAQRPAPAATQTTAHIRRKADIAPAPAAKRPASAATSP